MFQPRGCPQAKLLEQDDELGAFARRQHGHGFLHVASMTSEGSFDQAPAFGRESNDSRAEVSRISFAANQLLGFQPVNRGGNRAAGEKDPLSYDVHWLRALVEQKFQHRKVR